MSLKYPMDNKANIIFSSVTQSCLTLCDPMDCSTLQASLPFINSCSLLKLVSIRSVMPSNQSILCSPLLLLPSVFPSIKVFSNESVLHIRWPNYWSFSFSISPDCSLKGLFIERTVHWKDCSLKGLILKNLLQHHSLKASLLQRSPLWSNSYIHTWLLEKP